VECGLSGFNAFGGAFLEGHIYNYYCGLVGRSLPLSLFLLLSVSFNSNPPPPLFDALQYAGVVLSADESNKKKKQVFYK